MNYKEIKFGDFDIFDVEDEITDITENLDTGYPMVMKLRLFAAILGYEDEPVYHQLLDGLKSGRKLMDFVYIVYPIEIEDVRREVAFDIQSCIKTAKSLYEHNRVTEGELL